MKHNSVSKVKSVVSNKNQILVLSMAFLLFALSFLCWFKKEDNFSESERRVLAKFPEMSLETVLNGEFMEDFEAYSLDQFPFRNEFRGIKALTSYGIFRKKDNNNIYLADGYLSKMEYPIQTKMLDNAAMRMEEIYDTYLKEQGSMCYFSIVPDKNFFLAEKNGYLSMDYEELFSYMKEKVYFADYIDISGLLGIEDYYKTDTHWRQEKILDVAEHLKNAMQAEMRNTVSGDGDMAELKDRVSNDRDMTEMKNTVSGDEDMAELKDRVPNDRDMTEMKNTVSGDGDVPEVREATVQVSENEEAKSIPYEIKELEVPFYGVYYGQAALPVKPDQLYYLDNDILRQCKVTSYDTGKAQETTIYNMEKANGNDAYEMFLSGTSALQVIENPNAEQEKELIVFRDSFGSSLVPLMVDSYSKITVIDTRYVQSKALGNLVDFHGQDTLFLYSTVILNNSMSMR